jgi:site-specific DNA recombinase
MPQKNKITRCAIYTRKSSEEGLDQEFNSLDAQRVAGEAYIQSQIHEGWQILPELYDDGGFSGGNMKRPALESLIADIEAGKVDTVVVYKVDRLSRSLHDFAKLVELFDKHEVTFVSVTQAFNTTNSMGRLTLNILLSFAQFEREVTGERIRDKFAASKKKGLWMGGPVPLGYDVVDRKLLVNKAEVEQVEYIYEKYLHFQSVEKLLRHIKLKGFMNKRGRPYTKHSLRTVLTSVLYIGKISHKDKVYDGAQQAILRKDLWDKVQKQISENTFNEAGKKNETHAHLLKGKVFDEEGNVYVTTYTGKGAKRYDYYLNKETGDRVNVKALNETVLFALENETAFLPSLNLIGLTKEEIKYNYKKNLEVIAKQAVEKIVVHENSFSIFVDKVKVESILQGKAIDKTAEPSLYEMNIDMVFKSYEGRKSILLNGHKVSHGEVDVKRHESMVRLIVQSFKLNEKFEKSAAKTIKEFAKKANMDRTYLGDLLKLKYLDPEIIAMIFKGQCPMHLNASKLMRTKLSRNWQTQKEVFDLP